MRYLFTIHPAFGHFHAVVPLAKALLDHGHEVAFATGRGFGPVVERAGFRHFACGLDFDGRTDLFEALPAAAFRAGRRPSGPLEQLRSFVDDLAPLMANDLMGVMERWRPDVILRDPVEFGGYIAAERQGVPHATPIWTTYISAKALCPDAVADLRRRYRLPDDPALDSLDRYLVLDFLPAEWTMPQLPYPAVAHRFCAAPFDLTAGDAALPRWIGALPHPRTVYATLGTTFNQSPDSFRAVLAALAGEPVNLIMTVGRSMNPGQFGPQPPNVRIEQYIPQSVILPYCDALVFHGGYNSLQSAFWHGLPVVVLPQGAGDNLPTGWRVAEVGAGVLIEGNPPEPEAIRAAVRAVLEQEGYRRTAERLRRAILALPGLDEAVRRLEVLARDRQPQPNDERLQHLAP